MTAEELPEEERTRCEVYSRVMGYIRPTEYWNIGKQGEWAERKPYEERQAGGLLT